MNNDEILEKLRTIKKGRYVSLKKTKDLGKGLTKESELVVRLGVKYSNMKINKDKNTESLPWGKWIPGYENTVIEYKNNLYLRVTNSYNKNNVKTKYLLNGAEITKADAIKLVGEKKIQNSETPVCNIKFSNIIKLGK